MHLASTAPSFPELAPGIVPIADYEELLRSPGFIEMERFSDAFLAENRSALAAYARHWVKDPLHQWSRQWEYPYVAQKLAPLFGESRPGGARVLDAGSGLTFFPAYLAERMVEATIECCDFDPDNVAAGARLRHGAPGRIHYREASIQHLPYGDGEFDAVYCISVLEHTRDYASVVREFRRVLAPGGLLVVTFDVSPDGRSEIDPAGARGLLASLAESFVSREAPAAGDLDAALARGGALSTTWARETHPRLVPWQRTLRSTLGTLARGRIPRAVFYDLVVCCGVWSVPGRT
jgi:ubiquinone/menaquinone biosynthesis C-methylase UbiE